jgi:hypothetical protein
MNFSLLDFDAFYDRYEAEIRPKQSTQPADLPQRINLVYNQLNSRLSCFWEEFEDYEINSGGIVHTHLAMGVWSLKMACTQFFKIIIQTFSEYPDWTLHIALDDIESFNPCQMFFQDNTFFVLTDRGFSENQIISTAPKVIAKESDYKIKTWSF